MKCKKFKCNEEATNYSYCLEHFKKARTYEHGLSFSRPLDKSIDSLKLRIDRKKASMMLLDGGVGEGKTTLAVELADYFNEGPIDLKLQYAIGGEQFQEKLVMCFDSDKHVLIYDEAGDFNTRGSLTSFNQMLNRVFDTFRAFKILVILVLPSFSVLDNSLFDKRIPRMLIHCHDRSTKAGHFKVYSLYRMYYLKHKIKKYVVPAYAYSGTSPNFRGHFLDLSPKRSLELEKISIEGKKTIVNENILKNRGLVSYKDIARKLGCSVISVKKKVLKMKIKEAKVYKRNKYFDKGIIDRLQN